MKELQAGVMGAAAVSQERALDVEAKQARR